MVHGVMLDVAYESLGRLLKALLEYPEVKSSKLLHERIKNAVAYHGDIGGHLRGILDDNHKMAKELFEIEQERSGTVDSERLLMLVARYKDLHDAGATPKVIYRLAKIDHVYEIQLWRILTSVFNLSRDEAEALIQEFEK